MCMSLEIINLYTQKFHEVEEHFNKIDNKNWSAFAKIYDEFVKVYIFTQKVFLNLNDKQDFLCDKSLKDKGISVPTKEELLPYKEDAMLLVDKVHTLADKIEIIAKEFRQQFNGSLIGPFEQHMRATKKTSASPSQNNEGLSALKPGFLVGKRF